MWFIGLRAGAPIRYVANDLAHVHMAHGRYMQPLCRGAPSAEATKALMPVHHSKCHCKPLTSCEESRLQELKMRQY